MVRDSNEQHSDQHEKSLRKQKLYDELEYNLAKMIKSTEFINLAKKIYEGSKCQGEDQPNTKKNTANS